MQLAGIPHFRVVPSLVAYACIAAVAMLWFVGQIGSALSPPLAVLFWGVVSALLYPNVWFLFVFLYQRFGIVSPFTRPDSERTNGTEYS